jgi:L-arabinose transport system ATP-binding protein
VHLSAPAQTTGADVPVLRADGLSKRFGPVRALEDVTLDVRAGEVLALLGENGAGKSTLLKILSGDHVPDAGRVLIDGAPADVSSPRAAHAAGLRVIAQEPEIIPHVSVAENIHVGALPARGRLFDRGALLERTRADIERLGFAHVLDATTLGERLSPAQRQLVEVLRALASDVRVIAFDEPTSSLSDHEVDALFALIRRLRGDGVAVIYVSHRMKEIFEIADRVAVLRDGALVGVRELPATSEAELVRMMVGRDLGQMFARERGPVGDVVLEVDGVTSDDVSDVSLWVRAGEVVALAGLVGAGRTELARALVGDVPIRSGAVRVGGRPVRLRSPRDAVRAGIGLAPEERKAEALLLKRSIRDNISLAILDRIRRARVVRRDEERRIAQRYADQLRIRTPSIEREVSTLSGGNQQKTVLARWLARQPQVLILDEPTRGVDVGAKAEIYSIIDHLAAEGVALLVISSDLPEVLGIADRVVVMQGGRVAGELDRHEASEETILRLAIHDTQTTAENGAPA